MAEKETILTQRHHRTHWHYVKRRRKLKKAHTAREIFYGQLISLVGATVSGLVLDASKTKIAALIGAYLILPGVFDLGGSVAGAMAARLNHVTKSRKDDGYVVARIILSSLLLVICSAVFLAIFSAIVAAILFGADAQKIFTVTIGSVVISSVIGLPIVALSTILGKKDGLDPDNFIGPIESSVFDVLSIWSVTLMVVLVS